MTEEAKKPLCPNCQQPAIREGNKIICEACDATYIITKEQGAKVDKTGELADIKQRLAQLERIVAAVKLPGDNGDENKMEIEDKNGEEEDII